MSSPASLVAASAVGGNSIHRDAASWIGRHDSLSVRVPGAAVGRGRRTASCPISRGRMASPRRHGFYRGPVTFPTAQHGLGAGDYCSRPLHLCGPTFLETPHHRTKYHGSDSVGSWFLARQFPISGLVSVLVSPLRFRAPIYVQCEVDTTTYVDGTAGLPPLATRTPAETVFIAPEVFVGPVKGMRFAEAYSSISSEIRFTVSHTR